ncbi:hypothetical protein BQ1740_3212 [Bacillus subtilis]|nr:hypothetical protein BQ1740_3212 [Bacillus subtilis]
MSGIFLFSIDVMSSGNVFWEKCPDLLDLFSVIRDFSIITFLKNDKLFTDYYFGRSTVLNNCESKILISNINNLK